MNTDFIDTAITSTALNILTKYSPIEILSDDLPDLTFDSSSSLVCELFQCITSLQALNEDNCTPIKTKGHQVYRQKGKKHLSKHEEGESRIYIIEHEQYCITIHGDYKEVHFYQRFPPTKGS